jgi:hypothetical protein
VFPDRRDAAFAKYGVFDAASIAAEDAAWRARFEADPAAHADWLETYAHFEEHWSAIAKRPKP